MPSLGFNPGFSLGLNLRLSLELNPDLGFGPCPGVNSPVNG